MSDLKTVSQRTGLEAGKRSDSVNKIKNISECDIFGGVTSFEINRLDEIPNGSEIFSNHGKVNNCKTQEIKKEVLLGSTQEREKGRLSNTSIVEQLN